MRHAVIGAGAWGTALADVLARNGHDVAIWAYETDVSESITREHMNHRFLADHSLATTLRATSDIREALDGADMVTFVAPSHVLRRVAASAADAVAPGVPLVVATKGIEHGSLSIMTDVVAAELPERPVVALSGPSFAAEVAARQPTAIVAASEDSSVANAVQMSYSNETLRIYTHSDVTGVELGGALKNVMAVATGIGEGLGTGFNSRAALITRGLAEMTRLGLALGADPATFAGLAGMGDLVLTCTGALSRNRAVGLELGKGRLLEEILAERETVAEGVTTTGSAYELAEREGVQMPIVTMVHRILFEGHSPRQAITDLMSRDLRSERD